MSGDEFTNIVKLKLEKDMIFKCDMGDLKVKDCYIDETNVNEADMWGPNPSRLLATAILGCLSASFIYCLKKREFVLDSYEAEAKLIGGRNEKGFLRVKEINVKLMPKSDNEDVQRRMEKCLKVFEQFCTVTQSVRAGIKVNVNVDI
ncbi:MAG: OsmC family protein [Candidatus Helarchaeota archaeon]|nr:OsmC family protein [Candidatus Helarchaeota archaeon]